MSGNWQINSGITLSGNSDNVQTSSAETYSFLLKGDTIRLTEARTPATPTATGYAGEISWDENNLYVHNGTEWKKLVLQDL